MTMHTSQEKNVALLDIQEAGKPVEGKPQKSNERLYFQLQVFAGCKNPDNLKKALDSSGLEAVFYLDLQNPTGVGLLFMVQDPTAFSTNIREFLNSSNFFGLTHRPEMTMLGRTYSSGREADLKDWLLQKPRRTALNPEWPWAIWYPMRRKPEFELLAKDEQGKILHEHAKIGMSFGRADLAHDIRLACYGLDKNDNEFVIGLIGKELYALSRVVQDMRKTQQTARYVQSLGPFFVGKALWQSPLKT